MIEVQPRRVSRSCSLVSLALMGAMLAGSLGCAGMGEGTNAGGVSPGPVAGVVAPTPAPALAAVTTYAGRATDPATGALLYTEVYQRSPDGLHETVRYTDADGAPLGEKTLDYTASPYAPLYHQRLDIGYTEAVTPRTPDGRTLTVARAWEGDTENTATVTARDADPLVVDAGLNRFIVDHLPALERGEAFTLRLIVVPLLEAYRLQVAKTADTAIDGHPAVTLEVGASSFLLRLVAEPARLTYDLASHRLVRYEGLSTVRNPQTGRVYRNVRVVYSEAGPSSRF